MTVPVIEVTGAAKAFGAVRALAGVDFAVRPGECVGLVGGVRHGHRTGGGGNPVEAVGFNGRVNDEFHQLVRDTGAPQSRAGSLVDVCLLGSVVYPADVCDWEKPKARRNSLSRRALLRAGDLGFEPRLTDPESAGLVIPRDTRQ